MSMFVNEGDRGITSLVHTQNISKSDDRVRVIGSIEELNSHLMLLASMCVDQRVLSALNVVQNDLKIISDGIMDSYKKDYRLKDESVDVLNELFEEYSQEPAIKDDSIPGQFEAHVGVVKSVARRVERDYAAVAVKFGADQGAKKYLNRLSDFFDRLIQYLKNQPKEAMAQPEQKAAAREKAGEAVGGAAEVKSPLDSISVLCKMTLSSAKYLIEQVEAEAERRGMKAVIAVCGSDGRPIAVHAMDGAFLVSFDVAIKKAYTAVAVQMSTKELKDLTQPGGTFYGLDKMEGGNIIIFGGGIPVRVGETIIGGLGVSGGTGEQDHSLAEYGIAALLEKLAG